MSNTRKKKPISIRFRFRASQAQSLTPRQLLIRLTVEGRIVSDYGSGVTVIPAKWDAKRQLVTGRGRAVDETNERLSEIVLQHREILRELRKRYADGEGPLPTADGVKAEFVRPGSTSPSLLDWYGVYLNYLHSLTGTEDGRAEKTVARLEKTNDYLQQFDTPPRLSALTTGWAKRFHAWLQIDPVTGSRRMQKDSANKYLSHVRGAIDHAVDEGFLRSNPLDKFRPKRGKGKEVYFLEPVHIERLLGLRFDDRQAGYVLWWAKLMCFTGLDYCDAVRYASNPAAYRVSNDSGEKIVITRLKPPCNPCEIPLLGQVGEYLTALFADYPTGPPVPVLADVNRHLKLIQAAIGFGKPLTSKILRKTAGGVFLREGYQISTVSKALGHSSIRTTEQHYVKVTTSATDYDMERVARMQEAGTVRLRPAAVGNPFATISKTS